MALIAFLIISTTHLYAPSISLRVTGKWTMILRPTDLVGGAGTDYANPFESDVDVVTMSISKTATPTNGWRIDVRKTDTNWDPNLLLYVKRSSDGTGTGTITGGTVYQEITSTDTQLFTGEDDRSKVGLQYQIGGFSVNNVKVDTYETTIYITVTEP